jgi:hypothetical protein
MGGDKKREPNAATNNSKGKDIGPDRLHADGIIKTAIKGESMKCAIWMEGNSLGEVTLCFLLRKMCFLSGNGSGYEHKGHFKKTNFKTSAAHTAKSEIKTVKGMVQSPIKARGEASLLEKLLGKKKYNKASRPPNEKQT